MWPIISFLKIRVFLCATFPWTHSYWVGFCLSGHVNKGFSNLEISACILLLTLDPYVFFKFTDFVLGVIPSFRTEVLLIFSSLHCDWLLHMFNEDQPYFHLNAKIPLCCMDVWVCMCVLPRTFVQVYTQSSSEPWAPH